MSTGELGKWASQLSGQCFGAVAWEGLGALASGGNDAVRRSAEGWQIEPVEADGRGIVSQEELKVRDALGFGLGKCHIGFPVVKADAGQSDETSS
jgi:hypothetical protein